MGAVFEAQHAQLEALRAELARREAEREAIELQARMRRLDESELMALIFEHLDEENPRVVRELDFDRLVILSEAEGDSERVDELALEVAISTQTEAVPTPNPARPATGPLLEHVWAGRGWADEVHAIDPELLDRPELVPDQRALLERARGRSLALLNLRRLAREPAIMHLDAFVRACRARHLRFCRVITGKGINSKADPVIKHEVLHWCTRQPDGPVLGWAPELDVHGEWGSMILELRSHSSG